MPLRVDKQTKCFQKKQVLIEIFIVKKNTVLKGFLYLFIYYETRTHRKKQTSN